MWQAGAYEAADVAASLREALDPGSAAALAARRHAVELAAAVCPGCDLHTLGLARLTAQVCVTLYARLAVTGGSMAVTHEWL